MRITGRRSSEKSTQNHVDFFIFGRWGIFNPETHKELFTNIRRKDFSYEYDRHRRMEFGVLRPPPTTGNEQTVEELVSIGTQ
jgi:hypothetical protein